MLYVIEHNNKVLNGPREWNYVSFKDTLIDELNIQNPEIPFTKNDNSIIILDENTHIYPVNLIIPEYDSRFNYIHGPFWDFSSGVAVGSYEIYPNNIDLTKNILKSLVKNNRFNNEISGTVINIQNTQISIDTSREGRNIFIFKYLLMADTDTIRWKFPETWLTLTKDELRQIIEAGAKHIQNQFDWESNKIDEIDSLNTIDELKLVDIGNNTTHRLTEV